MIPGFLASSLRLVLAVPVEYLIVAGGGASGTTNQYNTTTPSRAAGGGGAGGLLQGTLQVDRGTSQSIIVGAGGASANNGSDSVFASLTAIGGGRGGNGRPNSGTGNNGVSGGSGGGGGSTTGVGGAGIAGQGYRGGKWSAGSEYTGAGSGGGAGGEPTDLGATPGPGITSSISNTAVTYARGGYVGDQRLGTSANTAPAGANSAGAANTGEGGDGRYIYYTSGGSGTAYSSLAGLAGGSGIVILRYPISYNLASATTGSPEYTATSEYHIYKFTGSGSITL